MKSAQSPTLVPTARLALSILIAGCLVLICAESSRAEWVKPKSRTPAREVAHPSKPLTTNSLAVNETNAHKARVRLRVEQQKLAVESKLKSAPGPAAPRAKTAK